MSHIQLAVDHDLDTALTIESWDEQPTASSRDGRKFSRAQVRSARPATVPAVRMRSRSGTYEALLYYAADGGSTYVTVMEVSAVLQGREGSFVLTGSGTFDGTTAAGRMTIVPGRARAGWPASPFGDQPVHARGLPAHAAASRVRPVLSTGRLVRCARGRRTAMIQR